MAPTKIVERFSKQFYYFGCRRISQILCHPGMVQMGFKVNVLTGMGLFFMLDYVDRLDTFHHPVAAF